MKKIAWIPLLALLFASCTKTGVTERYLIFKFKFDPTQERLNDTGGVATVPAGNAALSPIFNGMSTNYVELSPDSITPLGMGTILYIGALKDSAIDFSKSVIAGNGETFLQIPLSSLKPGTYKWLRMSVAYQNFDLPFRLDTVINGVSFNSNFIGTMAAFTGYNTYFDSTGYLIKNKRVVTGVQKQTRTQGYWGFETIVGSNGYYFPTEVKTDRAKDTGTTVVNPLFATSPVPRASCVLTADFSQTKYYKDGTSTLLKAPLVITGTEKESIIVECSMSTNKSFEWSELPPFNGMWDPWKREVVIDMGIRGMKPVIK
jgi:hypothetical protein